jgi:hypothetical protein
MGLMWLSLVRLTEAHPDVALAALRPGDRSRWGCCLRSHELKVQRWEWDLRRLPPKSYSDLLVNGIGGGLPLGDGNTIVGVSGICTVL